MNTIVDTIYYICIIVHTFILGILNMTTIIMKSFLFLILFLASSCMTQRFYLTDKPLPHRDADYDRSQHFFVSGLAQENSIDVKHICKDKGASHIETHLSFFDVLAGLVTRGIYTPKTAKIYCDM